MSYLLLIGSIQAFFLAGLGLSRSTVYFPNKVLMGWMVILGINLLGSFFAVIGLYEKHPNWYGYDSTLVLLHGPLAYLYVVYYVNREQKFKVRDFVHFLPYVFYSIYFLYQVRSNDSDYDSIKTLIQEPDLIILSMLVFVQMSLILYSVLIFLKLRTQRKQIEAAYSYVEGVDLQWVKNMLVMLIIVGGILGTVVISSDVLSFISAESKTYFLYGCFALIPFYVLYQVVHYNIFQIGFTENPPIDKYAGSRLSSEETDQILTDLDKLMQQEKPYLDKYLSIAKLAGMLDIHVKNLSQVINDVKETTFFNYINQLRVEEVIDRMGNKAYQHFTILGIALDSGFNTKSAFNKAFKKATGLTPSQYRKQHIK